MAIPTNVLTYKAHLKIFPCRIRILVAHEWTFQLQSTKPYWCRLLKGKVAPKDREYNRIRNNYSNQSMRTLKYTKCCISNCELYCDRPVSCTFLLSIVIVSHCRCGLLSSIHMWSFLTWASYYVNKDTVTNSAHNTIFLIIPKFDICHYSCIYEVILLSRVTGKTLK